MIQPFQIALDPAAAEPTRYRGRDLVADGVAQHGRVVGRGAHAGAHQRLDVGGVLLVGEEPNVALDRQADHDTQAVACRCVEQPARRHRIGADRVDPMRRHQSEVLLDNVGLGDLAAVGAAPERAVGDAADVELFVADVEELAARGQPAQSGRGGLRLRWGCARGLRDDGRGRMHGEGAVWLPEGGWRPAQV